MKSLPRPLLKHSHYILAFSLLCACFSYADVKMPAIFGNHMVLQQEMKIPVWGTADAGEKITVTLGKKSATATADADGKWRVDLPPVNPTEEVTTLTVAGKNTLKFEDVLVGDVWICSGQSNMEFGLSGAHNAAAEIPKSHDEQLRIFKVTRKTSLDPVNDVVGQWSVCSPDSVPKFTAVGYFFARDLRPVLKRPIGLIGTYWGGTPAQSWTSLSGLKQDPAFNGYVQTFEKIKANVPEATASYPGKKAEFDEAMKKWDEEYGKPFKAKMEEWKASGQPADSKPQPAQEQPKPPSPPDGGPWTPSSLYNGMVAPLIPYAIKGVIWYQGEANTYNPAEYRVLFPNMIKDWRGKWAEGDFPFLFVQLAAYQTNPKQNWAFLRESQAKTLSLPNTGMAVAVDVGNKTNVHPTDKLDVGKRLALVARHVAYGEDIVYSGPMYESMKVDGGSVVLSFKNIGGGLIIGSAPWVADGAEAVPISELKGFMIAGEDKNWVAAQAVIKGDTVVVSSADVAKPVAVRYGWENSPVCNLYNKEQLPASPFRTDDWQ